MPYTLGMSIFKNFYRTLNKERSWGVPRRANIFFNKRLFTLPVGVLRVLEHRSLTKYREQHLV